LFLGTRKENSQDMLAKGRHRYYDAVGIERWNAKLNDEKVLAIRASTETCKVLSELFLVSKDLIARVRRGDTWSHVAIPTKENP
jgi:hypothetical protein